MDLFEFNKIAGALLASLLFVIVMHNAVDVVVAPTVPETAAYVVEGADEEEEAEETASDEPEGASLGALLAAADPARGAKVFKKCAACHGFDKDGKNKVGPNLYGIVGGPKAGNAAFKYSGVLKDMGGEWGFEDLAAFLTKPKEFAPGTKMAFAGLKKPEDVAAVIAFLREASDSPLPLPAE